MNLHDSLEFALNFLYKFLALYCFFLLFAILCFTFINPVNIKNESSTLEFLFQIYIILSSFALIIHVAWPYIHYNFSFYAGLHIIKNLAYFYFGISRYISRLYCISFVFFFLFSFLKKKLF